MISGMWLPWETALINTEHDPSALVCVNICIYVTQAKNKNVHSCIFFFSLLTKRCLQTEHDTTAYFNQVLSTFSKLKNVVLYTFVNC